MSPCTIGCEIGTGGTTAGEAGFDQTARENLVAEAEARLKDTSLKADPAKLAQQAVSFAAAKLVPLVFGSGFDRAADLLPWLVAGTVPWFGATGTTSCGRSTDGGIDTGPMAMAWRTGGEPSADAVESRV